MSSPERRAGHIPGLRGDFCGSTPLFKDMLLWDGLLTQMRRDEN